MLPFAAIRQLDWNFELILKILWLPCEASWLKEYWQKRQLFKNQIHTKVCVECGSEYYL